MKEERIIDCNIRTLELFGCLREEIIGHTPQDFSPPVQPDGRETSEKARDKIDAALAGEPQRFEWLHRKKSGASFLAEVSLSPLRLEGAPHLLAIVRDISERRDLERRLLQAQKMEAIGTLAGGIAHDFNNILSIMTGYTEVALLKSPQDSPVVENLRQVLAAGERAAHLVAQILTFSRKADGKPVPCELGPIVKETLKFLRASLPTTIEFLESISPVRPVIMDPTQIHQVVMNLCTNAFHAMEERGGVLEVTLAETLVDGEDAGQTALVAGAYALLTVSDSGEGIPPEIRERIFEPYFTTKEAGKGTGLGLAMVHGIVTKAGGAIKVYSEPGIGTTFRVHLPLAVAAAPAAGRDILADLPGGTERILVVDDEALIVEMTRESLETLGYAVTATTDSVEALARFRESPEAFDLVVTDLTMPKLNGEALVRELRAVRSAIPIILCTGFSERLTEVRLRDLGVAEVLMKPVPRASLAVAIRRALAGERTKRIVGGRGLMAGGRILVVDDEEHIREIFAQLLAAEGYEVTSCGTIGEVADTLATGEFDLAFVDIRLGAQSGLDVLRLVRERLPLCPVVMVTGSPTIETAAEALRHGAFDYIVKPLRQDALLRVSRIALEQKALLEERERYRGNIEAIFGSLRDFVVMVDGRMTVLEANEARGLCGIDEEHIAGTPFPSLVSCEHPSCVTLLESTLRTGRPMNLDRVECRRPDRRPQVVSLATSPLTDGGRPDGRRGARGQGRDAARASGAGALGAAPAPRPRRREPADAGTLQAHRAARRGREHGPGHRGERHRQGTRRGGDPLHRPAGQGAADQGQLRGPHREPPRERTLRPRERRLHGRGRRPRGAFQGG